MHTPSETDHDNLADRSVVGIDVSKHTLDVFFDLPPQSLQFPNSDDGVASLVQECRTRGVALAVVESTGRFHRRVAASLMEADIPVAIANPRHVRCFANAAGTLEKTDRVDARLLARFARAMRPRAAEKTNKNQAVLTDLISRRRGLVRLRTAETNRAGDDALPDLAQRQARKLLRFLDAQINELDKAIAKIIESDDDWRDTSRLIDSVPGIAADTANHLVASLPELGQLNRRQIAKLVGVAPLNSDSGSHRGARHIAGGRDHVRCSLYMATFNVRQHCDRFATYFKDLMARGKPYQVAMTACMRKLLVTLNQMVKTKTFWNPSLHGASA